VKLMFLFCVMKLTYIPFCWIAHAKLKHICGWIITIGLSSVNSRSVFNITRLAARLRSVVCCVVLYSYCQVLTVGGYIIGLVTHEAK